MKRPALLKGYCAFNWIGLSFQRPHSCLLTTIPLDKDLQKIAS